MLICFLANHYVFTPENRLVFYLFEQKAIIIYCAGYWLGRSSCVILMFSGRSLLARDGAVLLRVELFQK